MSSGSILLQRHEVSATVNFVKATHSDSCAACARAAAGSYWEL